MQGIVALSQLKRKQQVCKYAPKIDWKIKRNAQISGATTGRWRIRGRKDPQKTDDSRHGKFDVNIKIERIIQMI